MRTLSCQLERRGDVSAKQVINDKMHGLQFSIDRGLNGHFSGNNRNFFELNSLRTKFKVNELIG